MNDIRTTNALRILQSADELKSRLSGEFSAVHGLSVNEYFLLLHLEQASGNRLSRVELARRMHISASTVTRMVAPMEKIGLVNRESNTRDARQALVLLSDAGREKLNDARETFSKQAEYAFRDRWKESELESLSSLLHRLVAGSTSNLT